MDPQIKENIMGYKDKYVVSFSQCLVQHISLVGAIAKIYSGCVAQWSILSQKAAKYEYLKGKIITINTSILSFLL